MKNLVVDLEGTLIWYIDKPVPHPESIDLLRAARRGFDFTYLWTSRFLDEALGAIASNGFLIYLDGIVAGDREEPGRDVFVQYMDSKEYARRKFGTLPAKDLSLFGDSRNSVLIENRPTQGVPKERVIEVEPFRPTGGVLPADMSLMAAYVKALKMF